MNNDFKKILINIAFLLMVFGISDSGFSNSNLEKFERIKIKNFGQIDENYFRGGQPNERAFIALKELGIKTVIDLRKDAVSKEEAWVQKAGMKYFNIPLLTTRPATKEQTDEFLKLVRKPGHWPVYVHCAAGRHRTGAMTAIYRRVCYSWTADMAYKEMKRYGYYSFPNHGSLKEFVYKYVPAISGFERTIKSFSPAFSEQMPWLPLGAD